jgi:hypothetical protein
LIGVTGPRILALEIREKVRKFLMSELGLILNLEKTKVTNVSKKIPFLGYLIGRRYFIGKQRYGKK